MGKETKGGFRGRIGNVVYYTVGDQKLVRKRPFRGKRAKNSAKRMAAAKRFGIASKKAKALRQNGAFIFRGIDVRKTRYVFDKLLLNWINQEKPEFATGAGTPSMFDGFDFNPESLLTEKLSVPATVDWKQDGKIVITFPEIVIERDIQVPPNVDSIQWNLQVYSVEADDNSNNEDSGWVNFETAVDHSTIIIPATSHEISLRLKTGQIIIVLLALRYLNRGLAMADLAWMPTGIIGASYMKQ